MPLWAIACRPGVAALAKVQAQAQRASRKRRIPNGPMGTEVYYLGRKTTICIPMPRSPQASLSTASTLPTSRQPGGTAPTSFWSLMTRERWLEVARIVGTGLVILLYYRGAVPLPVLLAAVAVGLYPLVKTGILDLVHEHKIGTEIFVTLATIIAMIGKEYTAGAIIMAIILIAEFIAELNTERARASIKALIGSVPQVALVRRDGSEVTLP